MPEREPSLEMISIEEKNESIGHSDSDPSQLESSEPVLKVCNVHRSFETGGRRFMY